MLEGPHQFELQTIRNQLQNTTNDARYLGARHVPYSAPATEISYRLAAMQKAWYSLINFYNTETSLHFKVLIYRATVVNAALSGLETLAGYKRPLARQDLAPLQKFVNKNLKVLLRGEATHKEEA